MYTSFALIAITGLVSNHLFPSWELDYRLAKEHGEKQHKPLAIFVGSGSASWQQITREGKFDADVQKLLAQQYLRVYVDAGTDYGRKVAESFGLTGNAGLFISDRSGGYIAFRHEGTLPAKDLVRHLNRYSDPEHVVRTTETNQPAAVATPVIWSYQNPYGQQCLT
jgi:hypothetical protein